MALFRLKRHATRHFLKIDRATQGFLKFDKATLPFLIIDMRHGDPHPPPPPHPKDCQVFLIIRGESECSSLPLYRSPLSYQSGGWGRILFEINSRLCLPLNTYFRCRCHYLEVAVLWDDIVPGMSSVLGDIYSSI